MATRIKHILVGLIAAVVLILPATAWSATATTVTVTATPKVVRLGHTVSIDIKLWATDTGGFRTRVEGGILTVSLYDQGGRHLHRTYSAVPDGRSEVFGVMWMAQSQGRIKVEVVYSGPGYMVGRGRTWIDVTRPAAPTTTLPPTTTTTTTQPTTTTTWATTTTTTTLPPQPVKSPSKSTIEPPSKATPAVGAEVSTSLRLTVRPGPKPGRYLVSLMVTDQSGLVVDDGQVLVTVQAGRIGPGGSNQALLSAAAGRHELVWQLPAGRKSKTTIEAAYYGGDGQHGRYSPSQAAVMVGPR